MKHLTKFILFLGSIALLAGCEAGSGEMAATQADVASTGQGGSLARFAIDGDYLYTVSNNDLKVFDIRVPSNPKKENTVNLGFGVETIFPYQNHLFIGTQTGMQILDNTNPVAPQHLSTYAHVFSCDPVVVRGNYAFVTLRSGTSCRQGVNRLEVLDIQDKMHPQLVKEYELYNPFGLGIDGNTLFVCDGDEGLKVFDATDPLNISQTFHFKGINAYDVIPLNGLLLMIGEDGLYQYKYQNGEIELISTIPVKRTS